MNKSDLLAVLTGLGFGLSLIVVIGAQNAYVLRQGLRRQHVLTVVLVCAGSDVVLIAAGIGGLGTLLELAPWLLDVMRVGGAAFLLTYAAIAARRALHPSAPMAETDGPPDALWPTLATALALTWLNPHVYLDTVLLLGTVAGTHGDQRWWFGLGAAIGSIVWFVALGFGARLFRPLFARQLSWQVLDALIAVFMVVIAFSLVSDLVSGAP